MWQTIPGFIRLAAWIWALGTVLGVVAGVILGLALIAGLSN